MQYGSLTPSKNYTSKGEFERMMEKVGCYIRNDFYFKKDRDEQNTSFISQNTSIDCARACFNAVELCTDGWSFQIATKRCFFLNKIDIDVVRPNVHLISANMTLGWATGRKSCSVPGPGNLLISLYS